MVVLFVNLFTFKVNTYVMTMRIYFDTLRTNLNLSDVWGCLTLRGLKTIKPFLMKKVMVDIVKKCFHLRLSTLYLELLENVSVTYTRFLYFFQV